MSKFNLLFIIILILCQTIIGVMAESNELLIPVWTIVLIAVLGTIIIIFIIIVCYYCYEWRNMFMRR